MAINLKVEVRKGNLNKALSIFKKTVRNSGILQEYKDNQYYTKPTTKRREAAKRARRKKN